MVTLDLTAGDHAIKWTLSGYNVLNAVINVSDAGKVTCKAVGYGSCGSATPPGVTISWDGLKYVITGYLVSGATPTPTPTPIPPSVRFLVSPDGIVEVHPYILVTPLEKNPVFGTIVNDSIVPVTIDIWAKFGTTDIPYRTLPVIPAKSNYDFEYEFTTPDVLNGVYPCAFYIGTYGITIVDTFIQPAIRVTKTLIEVSLDPSLVTPPGSIAQGEEAQITFPLQATGVTGAVSLPVDVWTIKDIDKFYGLIPPGTTIVDSAVLALMEPMIIGVTKTVPLIQGETVSHIHKFVIPHDLSVGTHKFGAFFGERKNYFLLNDAFSAYQFESKIMSPLTPTPTPSDICTWITAQGGWNAITAYNIMTLVSAYSGTTNIGFTVTAIHIMGTVAYYGAKGTDNPSAGNGLTGCGFT